MKRRRPNHRLLKLHRSYTAGEAAEVLGIHKNTIRAWLRQGLPKVDDRRPLLILGAQLADFLRTRRQKTKRPCGPGEMYCLRCRTPKAPAGAMADYLPITATSGNLRGLCPDCGTLIHRRVSFAKLPFVAAGLELGSAQAERRIEETIRPSDECDSSSHEEGRADAQP